MSEDLYRHEHELDYEQMQEKPADDNRETQTDTAEGAGYAEGVR
jgi:hypothetical protein